jgi:hypothetical protein
MSSVKDDIMIASTHPADFQLAEPTKSEGLGEATAHRDARRCEACGGPLALTVLANQVFAYPEDGVAKTWRYALRQCSSCGLACIDPKPSWEILQKFYAQDYGCYDSHVVDGAAEALSLKYRLAPYRYANLGGASLRARAYKAMAAFSEWISGKTFSFTLSVPLCLQQDAEILEVGYGTGSWLLAMSRLG